MKCLRDTWFRVGSDCEWIFFMSGQVDQAEILFYQMPVRNIAASNAMMVHPFMGIYDFVK